MKRVLFLAFIVINNHSNAMDIPKLTSTHTSNDHTTQPQPLTERQRRRALNALNLELSSLLILDRIMPGTTTDPRPYIIVHHDMQRYKKSMSSESTDKDSNQ